MSSPTIDRVTALVTPICRDLGLDLYDVEFGGGQLTVTLDASADGAPTVSADTATDDDPPRRGPGITLDVLALATRLISRELDHTDPIPGRYTLEVTSPGLERTLRTPAHFRRALGSEVAVRLRDVTSESRRVHGVLSAADDATFTVTTAEGERRDVAYDQVDRARTVFHWGPAPKPARSSRSATKAAKPARNAAKPSTPRAVTDGPDTDTDTTMEAPAP